MVNKQVQNESIFMYIFQYKTWMETLKPLKNSRNIAYKFLHLKEVEKLMYLYKVKVSKCKGKRWNKENDAV